jgi:hypothetical protein
VCVHAPGQASLAEVAARLDRRAAWLGLTASAAPAAPMQAVQPVQPALVPGRHAAPVSGSATPGSPIHINSGVHVDGSRPRASVSGATGAAPPLASPAPPPPPPAVPTGFGSSARRDTTPVIGSPLIIRPASGSGSRQGPVSGPASAAPAQQVAGVGSGGSVASGSSRRTPASGPRPQHRDVRAALAEAERRARESAAPRRPLSPCGRRVRVLRRHAQEVRAGEAPAGAWPGDAHRQRAPWGSSAFANRARSRSGSGSRSGSRSRSRSRSRSHSRSHGRSHSHSRSHGRGGSGGGRSGLESLAALPVVVVDVGAGGGVVWQGAVLPGSPVVRTPEGVVRTAPVPGTDGEHSGTGSTVGSSVAGPSSWPSAGGRFGRAGGRGASRSRSRSRSRGRARGGGGGGGGGGGSSAFSVSDGWNGGWGGGGAGGDDDDVDGGASQWPGDLQPPSREHLVPPPPPRMSLEMVVGQLARGRSGSRGRGGGGGAGARGGSVGSRSVGSWDRCTAVGPDERPDPAGSARSTTREPHAPPLAHEVGRFWSQLRGK